MNCDEIKDLIDDYLNNNLDKDNINELEKHLKNCSDCQNELNSERKLLELIKQLEVKKAPLGLSSNVKEHLKAEKSQHSGINIFNIFSPSKMKISMQIAALLLIVLTASYSFIFLKSQFGVNEIKVKDFFASTETVEKSSVLSERANLSEENKAERNIIQPLPQKPAENIAVVDAVGEIQSENKGISVPSAPSVSLNDNKPLNEKTEIKKEINLPEEKKEAAENEKAQSKELKSDVQLPAKELFFKTAEKPVSPEQPNVSASASIITAKQEISEVKEKALLPKAEPSPPKPVPAATGGEIKKEVLAESKPDNKINRINLSASDSQSEIKKTSSITIIKSEKRYISTNDISKSDNAVKKVLQDFNIYTNKVDTIFDPATHKLKYKVYVCIVPISELEKFQNALSGQTNAKNIPNESDKNIVKDYSYKIDFDIITAPQKEKLKGEVTKVNIYIITAP